MIRSVLLFLAFGTFAYARTWTNTDGRAIEADYVSSDGTTVVLKLGGKDVNYPLEKLSQADRDFVELEKSKGDKPAVEKTGDIPDVKIDSRLFGDVKDYYKDPVRKASLEAFESGKYWPETNTGSSEDWIKRDEANETCRFYVPASYDGSQPYGLFLYISPSDPGSIPRHWYRLFDELKFIAVSANNVGNGQPMLRRVQLSMDAMSTASKRFLIDPKRRIVSGLSGGGHMAMLTAALYPEYFTGAISHAAQSYLPAEGKLGHFPGLELRDFKKSPRGNLKWMVISGPDDKNYAEIQESSKVWEGEKLKYRFMDVPGMGHVASGSDELKEAIAWVLQP